MNIAQSWAEVTSFTSLTDILGIIAHRTTWSRLSSDTSAAHIVVKQGGGGNKGSSYSLLDWVIREVTQDRIELSSFLI